MTLDSDGVTVKIVPHVQLAPNSGHRLRVVGSDVNSAVHLKASDNTALSLTLTIVFQTGDTIEATAGDKTDGQTDLEGDASLPDDIVFKAVGGVPLKLLSTSPGHHAFKFSPSLSQLSFRFNSSAICRFDTFNPIRYR